MGIANGTALYLLSVFLYHFVKKDNGHLVIKESFTFSILQTLLFCFFGISVTTTVKLKILNYSSFWETIFFAEQIIFVACFLVTFLSFFKILTIAVEEDIDIMHISETKQPAPCPDQISF